MNLMMLFDFSASFRPRSLRKAVLLGTPGDESDGSVGTWPIKKVLQHGNARVFLYWKFQKGRVVDCCSMGVVIKFTAVLIFNQDHPNCISKFMKSVSCKILR